MLFIIFYPGIGIRNLTYNNISYGYNLYIKYIVKFTFKQKMSIKLIMMCSLSY